jgi:hypothetical protein
VRSLDATVGCETIILSSLKSRRQLNSLGEVKLTVGITDQHLREVYSDPYIASIAADGRELRPVSHPLATYLSAWIDNRFVGAFLAIRFSEHEIEWHSLLFKSALKHSRQLGDAFLAWAFQQGVMRVTAHIYEYLKKAKNYGHKLGMKEEGFRRCAAVKDGKAVGVYMLGICRQEWRLT